MGDFYADANLIAHWTNFGYVEEAAIRNHTLRLIISHPELYDRQADALTTLFLAGPIFGVYTDSSVLDRWFELLRHHYDRLPAKKGLIQVRAARVARSDDRAETNFRR